MHPKRTGIGRDSDDVSRWNRVRTETPRQSSAHGRLATAISRCRPSAIAGCGLIGCSQSAGDPQAAKRNREVRSPHHGLARQRTLTGAPAPSIDRVAPRPGPT